MEKPISQKQISKKFGNDYNVLPMAAVWESGKDLPRLVVDATRGGVNGLIFLGEKAALPSLSSLVQVLAKSPNDWFAIKLDVRKAFRRIRLKKRERRYCCIKVKDKFFVPRTHLFGLVTAGWWWSRVATLCHRCVHEIIVETHAGFVYVDDSLWMLKLPEVHVPLARLVVAMELFLGETVHWGKLEVGRQISWVGYQICLEFLQVSLSQSKLDAIGAAIDEILSFPPGHVPIKCFQKCLGKMCWASVAFVHSRCFLQRGFCMLKHARRGSITISTQLRMDLLLWRQLVLLRNRVTQLTLLPASRHVFFTDACVSGIGGWLPHSTGELDRAEWFYFPFDEEDLSNFFDFCSGDRDFSPQKYIAPLELLAQLVGFLLWGDVAARMAITMSIRSYTDSETAVRTSSKWYARRDPMASILRAMAFICDRYSITLEMQHIPGKSNRVADSISRGRFGMMNAGTRREVTLQCIRNAVRCPLGVDLFSS